MRVGKMALLCFVSMVGSVAAENSSNPGTSTNSIPILVMGHCHPISSLTDPREDADSILTPNIQAKEFLNYQEHHAIEGTTNTSILQQPKHGALKKVTVADRGRYYEESASFDPAVSYHIYIPEKGYSGKDSASVLVDFGTVRVEVVYFFQVINDRGLTECDWPMLCEQGQWRISSTLSSNNAYQAHTVTNAVVLNKFVINQSGQGNPTTFLPGAIVHFDKTSDDKVHVVYGYGGGLSIKGEDVWIPRDAIVTKDQFVRVNKWEGASSAAYESIDTVSTYAIHQDGSIESSISGNCGVAKLPGHLYRFKNVLWVRNEKHHDDLEGSNTFVILPLKGELCSPHYNDKCAIGR
ncbi:MAG: hypothetical protein KJ795_07175 [Gammaproteobacteria bacterium]|nr:hypothetical protein [Gammaproteobacteria bacterium]MBU1775438.1 hypothetical protein [Gammaproteobacteria bacterium]MBU1969766.1 hypothetical protein [Gammaproteobacteria bacterium]